MWVQQVAGMLLYRPETLQLAIFYMDYYIATNDTMMQRNTLEMLASTSLWLAGKVLYT